MISLNPVVLVAIIVVLGLTVACADRPAVAPTPNPAPIATPAPPATPLELVVFQPASVTLKAGQTQRFNVVALDRFENPVPNPKITFIAREESGRIDSNGNFTAGAKAGTYEAAVIVQVSQGTATMKVTADVTIAPRPPFLVDTTEDATDADPGDEFCKDSNGHCTLRAAIMEANALAGRDSIELPAGIYNLAIVGVGEDASASGDLDINVDLTISGAGSGDTIIDGAGLDRVFHVLRPRRWFPVRTVNISGVKIQNGKGGEPKVGSVRGGGGIFIFGGTLTLTDVIISNNNVPVDGYPPRFVGGGIFNQAGTVILTDSAVSDNSAGNGGGIFNDTNGTLTIANSTVSRNSARVRGGGIFGGTVILTNSTVSDNSAHYDCGGIDSPSVTLVNSRIKNNTASRNGGGVSIAFAGTLTLTNSIISGNAASGDGGGLFLGPHSTAATLIASTISDNSAVGDGAGIYVFSGPLDLVASTFVGNSANSGDAIYVNAAEVSLTNSTINGKSASKDSVGIFMGHSWGTLIITSRTNGPNDSTTR